MGALAAGRAALLGAALVLFAAPARAERASLTVSSGQYGIRPGLPQEIGVQVEVRAPWRLAWLRPAVGMLAGGSGGAYVFGGFVAEVPLSDSVSLTPGFAPGIVLADAGRGLGAPVEFRSSLEVSLALRAAQRVGISFSHISNGGLGRQNPGVETILLGLTFGCCG